MTPVRIPVPRADGTSFQLTGHLVAPSVAASDGARPVVLVVPAMGLGARYYRPLTEALAEAGVDAVATELRGHEEAGPPAGRANDFGYAELVDDLDLAVRALSGERDGARVHLLGHSLGGQLSAVAAAREATRTAAGQEPRLAGLALVASGTPYWRTWSPAMLVKTQVAGLLARVLGHFPGDRFGFAGREAPTQMTDWARLARTGRFSFGTPRADEGAAMATSTLPVLAVTLEGDQLAPPASMQDLTRRFATADVERVHLDPAALGFPEADHLRWARQPGVVVPTLTGWLARTAAPTRPATPPSRHAG